MNSDTICALATAPGGALGIIRISGPNAWTMVEKITTRQIAGIAPNTIIYTHIKAGDEMVDEVMVSLFQAPHSYTGEDAVEISCHGSSYILNKVLNLLVENGCRMAKPGEYIMRAFLNGKMDLSQAEAVADLIASSNKATHQMAMSQLRGGISSELATLRTQLLHLTSLLELELDFSDHEDLEFADRSELQEIANRIDKQINRLINSFQIGQALKQGIPVAIIGKTNVGKSTLLNCLLHDDRAIVSDIHGTTRDTIEDVMEIQGIQFRFIDTAGIRQTTDQVEQIGIERTFQAIQKAHIILWLIDAEPTVEEYQEILEVSKDKQLIIIQNKIDKDIVQHFRLPPFLEEQKHSFVRISAKHHQHIDLLEQAIFQAGNIPTLNDSDVIVSNARHYDVLIRASQSLSRVIDGLQKKISGDILSEDLRDVINILSEITGGQITTHEVLENIFTHFCVGK